MEDHVVDFIDIWRVGIGMLGEEGAESIHTTFNQLTRNYTNMMNGVEQLKSERYNVVMEHYQQICPDNFALQPPPVKRMKKKARQLFASALYTPQSFPFIIIYLLRVLNVLLLVYIIIYQSYSIQQTCRQFNELLIYH